jgi:Ca2+-binding EF-hand superfamily protein
MGIYLSPEERDALMSRFDTNRDGNISDVEIYNVLSRLNSKDLDSEVIEQANLAIKKIAAGAEDHASMKEYVKVLFKKFDLNNDGLITMQELSDGLKRI